MNNNVTFRDFELRDVDFVYKAKNDRRLNDLVIGYCSSFSYEDALSWVRGCMKLDSNYRYWAICTNDEFKNIVGWCGICEIDHKHRMAGFKSITIYDSNYRDTLTWYCTWNFILEYVYYNLGFNRVYAIILPSHDFHMQFFDIFPNSYEGVLKHEVFRNGKYEDVILFGLYRNDYEMAKEKGVLEFDALQSYMKRKTKCKVTTIESIEDYIEHFVKLLDSTNIKEIHPETRFRELVEWSSLFAISMVSILEEGLHVQFDMRDLNKCDTIVDLYNMVIKQ